jgi:hypothetical protein
MRHPCFAKPFLCSIAIFLCLTVAHAQQVLHNDDIIKMHSAGLSNEIITSTINSQPGVYSTSIDDLIALKKAGIDDKIVKAMIEKNNPPVHASIDPVSAPAAPTKAPQSGTSVPGGPIPDQAPAPIVKAQDGSASQPRVFLTSASHGNNANAARDQSMEMSKDFEKECPSVRISIYQQAADYTVLLNHIEIGLFIRDNQIQVADKDGDLISKTKEGGSIAGGVKKACAVILADWDKKMNP